MLNTVYCVLCWLFCQVHCSWRAPSSAHECKHTMKRLATLQSWHLLLKVVHDSSTDKMMSGRLLALLQTHAVRRSLQHICSARLSSLRGQNENITTAFCQPGSCFNKSDDHRQRAWPPFLAGHSRGRRFFSLTPAGIVNAAPASVQPYLRLMRLDKPIGEPSSCEMVLFSRMSFWLQAFVFSEIWIVVFL